MAASQRNLVLILLGLAAAIAMVIVVLPTGQDHETVEVETPGPNQNEDPAELAEIEALASPELADPTADRVEAAPIAPATDQDGAPFGSFPVLVLDLDGSPAAGVQIRSSRGDPSMDWQHLMYSPRDTREVRTDEQGRATLPYPDAGSQSVLIGARKHAACAMQRRERDLISASDAWVLQLESKPSMIVRLIDRLGQPVVGQEVCWWQDPSRLDRTLFQVKSDAQGEAHFDDLPRLSRGATALGTAFGLQGVFVQRPMRVVQDFEQSQSEIELQVPETGSIQVRVRYEDDAPLGRAMSTAMCYRLSDEEVHSEFFRWQRADGQLADLDEGLAEYLTVEIGQRWQFAVLPRFFGTPITSEILGPHAAGERLELEVVLPPDPMARHTVRILDPQGAPIANARIQVSVGMTGNGGSSQSGSNGTTDEEGFMTLDLPTAPSPESWTLKISLEDKEKGGGWSWSGAGTASEQSHDMPNEVRLQEVPRIVSGYAVFADGSLPEQWVQFSLGVRARDSNEVRGVGNIMNVANQVGTFDMRSEQTLSGQIVVSARLGEVTEWTDLDVAFGQENVRIELPAIGSFAVRAGENQAELFARLQLFLMLPGLDAEASTERSPFSSESVPRGDSLRASRLPLAEGHTQTQALTARAGPMQWAAKDAFERLIFQQAFDLRAGSTFKEPQIVTMPPLSLQKYTLRVRGVDGAVLPRAYASFAIPGGSRRGLSIQNGVMEFACTEFPPELKVRANGFVEQTVNWTGPELDVILQPEP